MSDDDLIRRGDALDAIAAAIGKSGGNDEFGNMMQEVVLQNEDDQDAIAAIPAVTPGVMVKPTDAQVASACLSYRHDFGLLDGLERTLVLHQARDWLHAWQKELDLNQKPTLEGPDEGAGEMLERLGMDGAKWAAEFRSYALRLGYSDMDEGWLIGWFANAIMAGYDRRGAPDATIRDFQTVDAPDVSGQTQAAADVLAERARQVIAEGWDYIHDDCNDRCELAQAAACYALSGTPADDAVFIHGRWEDPRDLFWPHSWSRGWWKPTDRRRDLVKAGALILAEIERLDRAALAAMEGKP